MNTIKRKTAYIGLFAAVAIIFGYVESLLPIFVAIPGVKLGIANLVSVIVMYLYSWKEATLVSVIRICVIGFMFGNLFAIAYSMAGMMLSMAAMIILKKLQGFSMAGVSIGGGVTHNVGQLLLAMVIVENFHLMYYMPVLLISGLITGFLVGLVATQIYKRILPVLSGNIGGKAR